MIPIPRNDTLAEALYRDIEKNDYLQEIYENLLYNRTLQLYGIDKPLRNINISHAIRFSDILSKSAYAPTADRDHMWGQELAILLRLVYPQDERVRYALGSSLSALGNYRGLTSEAVGGFASQDLLDQIYYEYDKDAHKIPGKEEEYFFNDQMAVYRSMGKQYFSYSGPTSMGKSFVVRTYIQQQIENGSTDNFAILVPTKALINEVRSNIIGSLQVRLKELNYRVVTAAGDLVLKQDHHFIFVMTPERLLHMMIERDNIHVDFLFIDEAHKISERGGRSTYYYKIMTQLRKQARMPNIIFASPNIPNPEVYMGIIPGIREDEKERLASKYAPVCQFKYFVDFPTYCAYYHNDYTKKSEPFWDIPTDFDLPKLVAKVGGDKQNVIYCSSRSKVVDFAIKYARNIQPLHDPKLDALAAEIRKEVHPKCYLAALIERGVAYHVGYLPGNIRLRLERSFEEGILRTIFCTSTLVEGVNLPADNLFITSYRDGPSNMDEVEFRNLVGRVGRIKYNLYGNVILVRLEDSLKEDKYKELLKRDIPQQVRALEAKENVKYISNIVEDLVSGDIQFTGCHKAATETEFEALRKFALILTRDLAAGEVTPVTQAFDQHITPEQKEKIIENFPVEKTSEDITLSYDQADSLHSAIEQDNLQYPVLSGDDKKDYEALVDFLMKLRELFKWDIYEKETLGKPGRDKVDAVIRRYAVVLLRWIQGNGLSSIVYHAIKHKEEHPEEGIWAGNRQIIDYYNKDSTYELNLVIAESLGMIENVLLFSISNYFRKFSLEYKAVHQVDHFPNDWYEFVEYGTTNADTIFLQQSGFSREAALFILEPKNIKKYIVQIGDDKFIKRDILTCGNIGVETEAQDIQFNVPELFID